MTRSELVVTRFNEILAWRTQEDRLKSVCAETIFAHELGGTNE
jgi:hypothetical protein